MIPLSKIRVDENKRLVEELKAIEDRKKEKLWHKMIDLMSM